MARATTKKLQCLKCARVPCNVLSASKMTYIVSGGALNSTHSLAPLMCSMHCRNTCATKAQAMLRCWGD